MDILEELNTLKAEYTASTNLLETASKEIAELTASVNASAEAVKIANEAITARDGELSFLKDSLNASASEIETLKEKIAELQANEKSAEDKAVEIVASQGVAPIAVKVGEPGAELTTDEARAKYADLSKKNSMEAGRFYLANKNLIIG